MNAVSSSAQSAHLPASQRPTAWWLDVLRRRERRMRDEKLELAAPIVWRDDEEQRAAIKFFNAAFRAEESGLRQAHELADEVRTWDPDLAEVLRLYGNEEGWHRELLTEFLSFIGGGVNPMGKTTRALYKLYARAERMETIVLTNLMFETIGSTTYRMALLHVRYPAARQMLTILTRDESFHVPLNVHFLRQVLSRRSPWERWRLRWIYRVVFWTLTALPLVSRPKSRAFDGVSTRDLARGYARMLASLFAREPDLGLAPPRILLWALGVGTHDLNGEESRMTSIEAAEQAADRERVHVTAL
jgi:hypothetical protein